MFVISLAFFWLLVQCKTFFQGDCHCSIGQQFKSFHKRLLSPKNKHRSRASHAMWQAHGASGTGAKQMPNMETWSNDFDVVFLWSKFLDVDKGECCVKACDLSDTNLWMLCSCAWTILVLSALDGMSVRSFTAIMWPWPGLLFCCCGRGAQLDWSNCEALLHQRTASLRNIVRVHCLTTSQRWAQPLKPAKARLSQPPFFSPSLNLLSRQTSPWTLFATSNEPARPIANTHNPPTLEKKKTYHARNS